MTSQDHIIKSWWWMGN